MITSARFTTSLVLLAALAMTGCAPDKSTESRVAGTFVLYSLDGDRYPGEPAPEGATLLHGWLVLQECPITSLDTREKLFKALDRGIDEHSSSTPLDCFNPRHAIRVESMGITVDYLICFQCSNYYIYEGDKQVSGGFTTSSPKSTFDQILSSCN
jgi:hypothetical protein